TLHHYRDRDGVEVDAVLEHPAGQVIGIEVKSTATVRSEDFNGLRHLAGKLGSRFRAGFVVYTGQRKLPFGERFAAVPVSGIWRTSGGTGLGHGPNGSCRRETIVAGTPPRTGHNGLRRARLR